MESTKKKNVIFKKKILLEGLKTKDEFLNDELQKDCGSDELCHKNNTCLSINNDTKCSLAEDCCTILDENKKFKCVGGNKDGPTYDNNVDEWWYLGNHYKK